VPLFIDAIVTLEIDQAPPATESVRVVEAPLQMCSAPTIVPALPAENTVSINVSADTQPNTLEMA